MSLGPFIYRDIGEEVPASDRIIYAAFIRHLESGRTPRLFTSVKRAARDCGVPSMRVLEVVRKYNPGMPGLDDA